MIIYFISGLGADERIFGKLCLPEGYEIRHIPWETVDESENIASYAERLASKIDTSKPFMLAGLSFGGLVAAEICKFLKPEKLILFSTVKTSAELPALYRLAGKLKIYRIAPRKILRVSLPFLYWFLGPADKSARELLVSFLDHTNPVFLKWALREISCWKNTEVFLPHVHIHGENDRVFPLSLVNADHVIKGGTHLAVYNDADQINQILTEELAVVYHRSKNYSEPLTD
ncbi:alpha/beta hydrolase [Flavihumibacter sp. R14]|nr:alpha/beta hydrolase [Flavihumibacter soli]